MFGGGNAFATRAAERNVADLSVFDTIAQVNIAHPSFEILLGELQAVPNQFPKNSMLEFHTLQLSFQLRHFRLERIAGRFPAAGMP